MRINREWRPWGKAGPGRSLGGHLCGVLLPENGRSFVYDCLEPRSKRREAGRTSSERPPFWVATETDSGAHAYMSVYESLCLRRYDLRSRPLVRDLPARVRGQIAARSRLITADQIWSPVAHTGPGTAVMYRAKCGNLLKCRRGRKCEHGTMAGYEDAMSNIFASSFLSLPSDSRKTSDCLKFSALPSFEQYQDVPCRSKNAGSTISGLRWSPKHFVLTLLPWSFARQVVSFPMSTKFSAFYRCMLQLRAFCGCSARCRLWIPDEAVRRNVGYFLVLTTTNDYHVDRHVRLAIDGMSCGRLQALFPFQLYALPGKRIAQSFRLALAWMYEAMWRARASTRRLPASFVIVSS